MKRLIALFAGLFLTLALATPVFAAEKGAKKERAVKMSRVNGRVLNIKKGDSEFQVRAGNIVRTVVWTPETKWTYRNAAGSMDNLKDGVRVICLGKFEGVKLILSRVDIREGGK